MVQSYAIRIKSGTYHPPLVAGMYVGESDPASEIRFTHNIQAARTWESYQEAFSYVDENLYGIAEVVPVVSRQSRVKVLLGSLISLAIAVAIGGSILTTWESTQPCPVKSEKRISGRCYRDLQAKPLTLGVAIGGPVEAYNPLAAYLRKQLGNKVAIDLDTRFEELSGRIARKDWDIAFTRSPIFSITAEDNGYFGVALMFPDQPLYYRAALYVRSDSPIQSIADIKSTTTIALGKPESAPTFHMPIYALYGKSLQVGIGYRPREVVKMVKAGIVDVGAGRYAATNDDPTLRIIYVSRAIPSAGVYLSPKLSSTDRKRVQEALLNAPPEIQALAKYGEGQIPKYDELRKVISRTEEILSCPGFNINSFDLKKTVDLFCKSQNQDLNTIEGQVREYNVPSDRAFHDWLNRFL